MKTFPVGVFDNVNAMLQQTFKYRNTERVLLEDLQQYNQADFHSVLK